MEMENILMLEGRVLGIKDLIKEGNDETAFVLCSFETRRRYHTDTINVLMKKDLFDSVYEEGGFYAIEGEVRSRNFKSDDGKKHVMIYVYAKYFDRIRESEVDPEEPSSVTLMGVLCKEPSYYETSNNRHLTQLFLAVHRPVVSKTGKVISDYLPVTCWGVRAMRARHFEIGDNLSLTGRLQSRTYEKDGEQRTVHEVVALEIDKVNTYEKLCV